MFQEHCQLMFGRPDIQSYPCHSTCWLNTTSILPWIFEMTCRVPLVLQRKVVPCVLSTPHHLFHCSNNLVKKRLGLRVRNSKFPNDYLIKISVLRLTTHTPRRINPPPTREAATILSESTAAAMIDATNGSR